MAYHSTASAALSYSRNGHSAAADMLKFIISFGAGVYAGVYVAQNYQVPRVDEPQELWRKIKDFADQYRKSPPGV